MAFCRENCVPIAAWAFFTLGWVALGYQVWLLGRSHPYRTDLRPGESVRSGSAPFWQLNVLNPRNYSPGPGRKVHKRIVLSALCQAIAWGVAVLLFTAQA